MSLLPPLLFFKRVNGVVTFDSQSQMKKSKEKLSRVEVSANAHSKSIYNTRLFVFGGIWLRVGEKTAALPCQYPEKLELKNDLKEITSSAVGL